MNEKRHIGSDFDDFLREEHLLDAAEAVAAKRAVAFQIAQEMEENSKNINKAYPGKTASILKTACLCK